VTKLKVDHIQDVSDLKSSIKAKNEMRKLSEMETRLTKRQNEVVKALTQKLADRDETTKKFRMTNFHVNNLENFLNE